MTKPCQARIPIPFILFLALALGAAQQSDAVYLAEKAIEAKDYVKALALLREHVAAHPQDYRALFDIAYAHTLMGERAPAIENYRKALAARPQLTQAAMNLAQLLLAPPGGALPPAADAAEAAKLLETVVAARPKEARPRLLLAEALARSGAPGKAAEEYRLAAALDPKSYDARVALARLLIDQKQYSEAERELAQAAELQPDNFEVRLELARLWEATGRAEDALRMYREAAQKDPGNAAVRRRAGRLLLDQKKFAEAAAELEAAAAASPAAQGSLSEADRDLARAYAGAGQAGRAAPLLEKWIAAESNNPEPRMLLAALLKARRDFAGAQKQIEAVITLAPRERDAYVDLANLLYLQQNYAGTLRVLDHVAQMGQPTPWFHFLRAITLDKLEEVRPALESYQRFLAVADGKFPDQEFQARQRVKALTLVLQKGGGKRRGKK